jgi:death-on-curing family protein
LPALITIVKNPAPYPVEKLTRIDSDRIKRIHAVSIRYGKTFSENVRDAGSLDRIAEKIRKMAQKRKDGSFIVARSMELLVKDHPFWDGNHRTAFELGRLLCLLFGYRLNATVEEAVTFMRMIDDHDIPEEEIQKWVDERIVVMKGL